MELDNMKKIWNEQANAQLPGADDGSLQSIMRTKSKMPLASLKRNLLAELITVILCYGGVVVLFLTSFQGSWQLVAWAYFILGALYLFYFYRKYKLLKEMDAPASQVKVNLEQKVKTLEKYVNFYLFSGTAAIFLLLWFFWFLLVENLPYIGSESVFFPSSNRHLMSAVFNWFLVTVAFTLLMHQLSKRWVNKLYGQHIRKLRELINQMEEIETKPHPDE